MFFVLTAGSSRALGALFGLWGLYFVLGPAMMLRTIIGIMLSLPIMIIGAGQFVELVNEAPRALLLTIPLREFLLGFSIGILASLPFFAILGAGVIIDQYRGDSSPSIQGPENDQIGTFAEVKVVMSLYLFTEMGGFMILIGALYQSFVIFPPDVVGFAMNARFGDLVGVLLQNVIWLMIIVAMPIMTLLFLTEVGVNFVARLSKGIELPSIDFLMKSLIFTLAMPILVIGLARSIKASFDAAPEPLQLMQEFMGDE